MIFLSHLQDYGYEEDLTEDDDDDDVVGGNRDDVNDDDDDIPDEWKDDGEIHIVKRCQPAPQVPDALRASD